MTEQRAKGLSLNIGLNEVDPNHYGGWSGPLNACEADAEDMTDLAASQGFETTTILTAAATRSAVINGIENAASACEKGDIFFLSYSGHGGQVPDFGDDDEEDNQDETWCLFDGQLIDDELFELWAQFAPGVRVLVLSDSCHSGSVIKVARDGTQSIQNVSDPLPVGTEAIPYRVMPPDKARQTVRQNREFYRDIAGKLPDQPSPIQATVRLISGCQDNQLSLDGTFNGLFTGTLLKVWNDGAFRRNYARFHASILSRMPSDQSPNHMVIGAPNPDYDEQKPFTINP